MERMKALNQIVMLCQLAILVTQLISVVIQLVIAYLDDGVAMVQQVN